MNLDELWSVVRSIPKGKVASYGACGRALRNPATGWQVGRWMTQAEDDVPWWRVVAKSGNLPTYKRDVGLGIDQKQRLEREGVRFDGDLVSPDCFWDPS